MTAKSMKQQFADTMLEVGRRDPRLIVLVGDISHFVLQPFAKAYPGRYYNVGICEATIVGMSAGLAKTGLYPVVHTIAPFIVERAFEQIKLDFCYQNLAGNLVTIGSAFDYSNLGCTHHCYEDWMLIKSLPNTQIVYPASGIEFDTLFSQTYNNEALTLFRLTENQHGHEFRQSEIIFGRAIKVTEGQGLTIVVTGPHLRDALEAKEGLAQLGLSVEIIYVHTIRPLDVELIYASVRKTKRVLVIEEHVRSGSLGDEVLDIAHNIGGARFSWMGIPDIFIRGYQSHKGHCDSLGLNRDGILQKARSLA